MDTPMFIGVTSGNDLRFSDGTHFRLSDRFIISRLHDSSRRPFGNQWVVDGYGYDDAEPVAAVFVLTLSMSAGRVREQIGRMADMMNMSREGG